jgi:hypothetical protein
LKASWLTSTATFWACSFLASSLLAHCWKSWKVYRDGLSNVKKVTNQSKGQDTIGYHRLQ